MRLTCGCSVDDGMFLAVCPEHLCEQGRRVSFPLPNGSVACVAQDDVDLAMVFSKWAYNVRLEDVLSRTTLDAA